MLVLSSPSFTKRGKELAQFAIEHRLPSMFTFKHYETGRLIDRAVHQV